MGINVALVRSLLGTVALCTVALATALGLAVTAGSAAIPPAAISTASAVWFGASLWLWAYWLLHFRRTGQRREFWLCYLLPYGYALYRSVGVALAKPGHNA